MNDEVLFPAGCPPHLLKRLDRLVKLQVFANGLAGHYGVPVSLCGSALRGDNAEPRDWDVRLVLSDHDFAVRYGSPKAWLSQGSQGNWDRIRWRWADDCVKQTKRGWFITGLNIDFQVYPFAYWHQFDGQPRLRLDTRWADPGVEFLGAGEGEVA